jgi:hypothetical protein
MICTGVFIFLPVRVDPNKYQNPMDTPSDAELSIIGNQIFIGPLL